MSIACHLVATGKHAQQLEQFVERLQLDLQFMGYKLGPVPLVESRNGQYMVVVGSIVRKDGLE